MNFLVVSGLPKKLREYPLIRRKTGNRNVIDAPRCPVNVDDLQAGECPGEIRALHDATCCVRPLATRLDISRLPLPPVQPGPARTSVARNPWNVMRRSARRPTTLRTTRACCTSAAPRLPQKALCACSGRVGNTCRSRT